MNSRKSKTSDTHRLLLILSDKIDSKKSDKYVAWSRLSIYYAREIIKKSCKNSKFKISTPTWNEECELPDGLYSVPYVQDYFQYIFKNIEKKTLIILQQKYISIK